MSELELVKDKNDEVWREFYLRNPDIFVEDWFNIKLKWYQRIILKQMMRDKKFGDMYNYAIMNDKVKNATTMCQRYCRKCR